jgi:hypothetical protein
MQLNQLQLIPAFTKLYELEFTDNDQEIDITAKNYEFLHLVGTAKTIASDNLSISFYDTNDQLMQITYGGFEINTGMEYVFTQYVDFTEAITYPIGDLTNLSYFSLFVQNLNGGFSFKLETTGSISRIFQFYGNSTGNNALGKIVISHNDTENTIRCTLFGGGRKWT